MTDDALDLEDTDDVMNDFNFDDILAEPNDTSVDTSDSVVSVSEFDAPVSKLSNDDFANAFNDTKPISDIDAEDVTIANADTYNNEFAENDIAIDNSEQNYIPNNTITENDFIEETSHNTKDDYDAVQDIQQEDEKLSDNEYTYSENTITEAPAEDSFTDDQNIDFAMDSSVAESLEPANISNLKEYDGSASDQMYEIDKNFASDNFTGTPEIDTIHVNVGYNTYGWNVEFANGVVMSLRDVKEYQIRQGSLPFSSGSIHYGNKVIEFKNVKRIVVYESVKYFAYGA